MIKVINKMKNIVRYQQSPLLQSNLDIKSKQLIHNKSSFTSFQAKNPEIQFLKLPMLNSMKRSSSVASTERNTKFRLQNLEEKVQELAQEVRSTQLQGQEALNNIRFLKETLAINELGRIREDIKKQIKGFERLVFSTKASNEERSRTIRQDCNQLWNETQQLRQSLHELRMRIDNLEEAMGFQKTNF